MLAMGRGSFKIACWNSEGSRFADVMSRAFAKNYFVFSTFRRGGGRLSATTNKNGGENRSLELRHQVSNESTKHQLASGADTDGHKKQLPRLWKQTTPVSQAIIQNHLEHQHQTFARSPLMKELTVPSFGFESGEMSMLQSLDENPEDDFMSLLPPVSSQRRFSDNPLTAKQHGCCAYQPMISPANISYSSRNLDTSVKLQSAPARSFCCIYHKKHDFDRPYRSPNCTCSCSQLRRNPHSTSYSEMLTMHPATGAEAFCNSQHFNSEECGSRQKINRLFVEDVAKDDAGSRSHSPVLPTIGSTLFTGQPHQERLSRQICRDRLRSDRNSPAPFLDILSNKDTFEQELKRRLERECRKVDSCEISGTAPTQANASRLIPPDLVFSPASRRVSAIDIGEDVEGSSVIKMLTIASPSRQLSRQNSIYSMEEVRHQQKTSVSPQNSLCSDRGAFLTPEYQIIAQTPASNAESKKWVKPARSFDHFLARNRGVHRAASHSPSHLATGFVHDCRRPTAHRSDTDCFVRSPLSLNHRYSPAAGHTATEAGPTRTPEFLSLDSSNSDPQHLEIDFMKEHRHSFNPDGTSFLPQFPNDNRSDSLGDAKPSPNLPTSLATSVDCLQQRQPLTHRRVYTNYANSQTYREATRRLAQRKRQQRSGKDLHPRKSLEVEPAWSSTSQSNSLQSSNSPSRRDSNVKPLRQRSESELIVGGIRLCAQSPGSGNSTTRKCIRRDYTIDEKTDEIFQAFLQHDPRMDDINSTPSASQQRRKKSLQQS